MNWINLEQVHVEAGDELNARDNSAGQTAIIREEEIDAGFGRTGQVDGIGRGDPGFRPDSCVMLRGIAGERDYAHEGWL